MKFPVFLILALGAAAGLAGCANSSRGSGSPELTPAAAIAPAQAPRLASLASGRTRHYEYVFPDGAMYVYDIDHGNRLVQWVRLPGVASVRGVVVSPRTHMLYISYGSDRGPGAVGRLLAYDLVRGTVAFTRSYRRGIDSMAISNDGSRIYMPDGALSSDGVWSVIDAHFGNVIGSIAGGRSPHDTVVGLSGSRVYLGGRNYPYLEVASTATDRVFRRVGPLKSGVRPFTVNGRETIAYTIATGFLGFQASSITSGHLLFTVTVGPTFGWNPGAFPFSAPSHGISLSPNERELWVLDGPNNYVHVFDVAGMPTVAPQRVADIRLAHSLTDDGWLQHSRSGCFVYVGDSGDVLSAATRQPVAFLPPLRHTKEMLEIDWRRGIPVATTSRAGLGYVRDGADPPPPRCGS
ncbi:MAG TPA: hypothetical protein VG325_12730 [Solirubrobacteraceae bacterium]|nr:hypothetical protein [Solirubrobacteraceae bacterium]